MLYADETYSTMTTTLKHPLLGLIRGRELIGSELAQYSGIPYATDLPTLQPISRAFKITFHVSGRAIRRNEARTRVHTARKRHRI